MRIVESCRINPEKLNTISKQSKTIYADMEAVINYIAEKGAFVMDILSNKSFDDSRTSSIIAEQKDLVLNN